jgi:hypothetical protein
MRIINYSPFPDLKSEDGGFLSLMVHQIAFEGASFFEKSSFTTRGRTFLFSGKFLSTYSSILCKSSVVYKILHIDKKIN